METTATQRVLDAELDWAVRQATSFAGLDDMVRECSGGYVPTVRGAQTDGPADSLAKRWLRTGLEERGYRVY